MERRTELHLQVMKLGSEFWCPLTIKAKSCRLPHFPAGVTGNIVTEEKVSGSNGSFSDPSGLKLRLR